jgi:hemolysin III
MDPPHDISRPRFRGVLHQYSFPVSLACGGLLVAIASGPWAKVAAAIYALSLSGLLGVSALYHRGRWRPAARKRMRRLDHSMIFALIAGTYTPFVAVLATNTRASGALLAVWAAAIVGASTQVIWIDSPRWVIAALAAGMAWTMAATMPEVALRAGGAAIALVIAGGVLYSSGAVIYALRRPDPSPSVFGYHEVFHTLVVLAAALHFVAIAVYVLPRG